MTNSASTVSSSVQWLDDYHKQGYHFPVQVFSNETAQAYLNSLDEVERSCGSNEENRKLAVGHANSLLPFADEITRLPAVLDPVKAILGPDLIVWNASFFIKEPHTEDFISWHQDLTYWGLTDSHEVTAWVALSPSTPESGCVKFVPGSHTSSIVEHRDTFDENNLLSRGQELAVDVNEDDAVSVVLQPGEMSLHHGQVFHGSHKNQSDYRRVGLAIRYITPSMKQTTDDKTNVNLVSGEDTYGHFNLVDKPKGVLHQDDIDALKINIDIRNKFLLAGTER